MKFGHIKNPLTVIAIFAGVTEVGGTFVLPHITDVCNQRLYIWFLMLFPAYLISLFFLMLWFRHTHLYAPSDFADENNFVAAAGSVIRQKFTQELEEASTAASSADEADASSSGGSPEPDGVEDQAPASNEPPAEASHADFDRFAALQADVFLAEELALAKLSMKLGGEFQRRVSPSHLRHVMFDGVRRVDGKVTIIEVKYLRTGRIAPRVYFAALNAATEYYNSLSVNEKANFQLVFALVFDGVGVAMRDLAVRRLQDLTKSMPYQTVVENFDFAELKTGTVFD